MRRPLRVAFVAIPLLAVVIGTAAAAAPTLPAPGSASQIAKLVAASPTIATVSPTVASELPNVANDNAAVDYPKTRNGCLALGSCVFGDTKSKKKLVIMGDSHAQMWIPALNRIGNKMKLKVIVLYLARCPAATLDVWLTTFNKDYTGCTTQRMAWIASIDKLHPVTVLLADHTNGVYTGASGRDAAVHERAVADRDADHDRRPAPLQGEDRRARRRRDVRSVAEPVPRRQPDPGPDLRRGEPQPGPPGPASRRGGRGEGRESPLRRSDQVDLHLDDLLTHRRELHRVLRRVPLLVHVRGLPLRGPADRAQKGALRPVRARSRFAGSLAGAALRDGVVRRALPLLIAVATCMVVSSMVATGTSSASAARRASPRRLDLLVVAGQSNALGYQSYVRDPSTHQDVFTDAGRSPADRSVLLMWDESQVRPSGTSPVPLDTPQVLTATSKAVFGPEVGLARYLYGAGHHHLLVVKVAFSGTSLARDWTPTSPDFSALVSSVAAARTWAEGLGWAPTVAGLYWMQGETDAMSAATASAYRSNLKAFLANVRADLRLQRKTPIVLGQIDLSRYISFQQSFGLCTAKRCSEERTWNHEVMRAQAKSVSWRTFLARTSRLPRYEHFLHLSDLGELALGKEFGELSAKHLT